MSRVFDFLPDGLMPLALQFSKANPSASADNILTLPQGNSFIVLPEQVFHPLGISVMMNASNPAEKMTNGGFETAGLGGEDVFGTWVESAGNGAIASETGAGNFHGGEKSCKLTTGADTAVSVYNDIVTVALNTYLLTFWVKGDGATNKCKYAVYDNSNSEAILAATAITTGSTAWQQISYSFVAPADCISVRITLHGAATAAAVCYLDDVSVATTLCAVPTAVVKIAVDGTKLTEGPAPAMDDLNAKDFQDAHYGFYPVTAGKAITLVMTTTANYLPTTADVDAVLYGVLKHE